MWKEIRKKRGISQKEVAEDLKVSQAFISKVENYKNPAPYEFQIYYLKMRGLECDVVISKYLGEIIKWK